MKKSINRYGAIILCVSTVLMSCEDDSKGGSFSVNVSFGSPKPTSRCWISTEVRQLQENDDATLVRDWPPVAYYPEADAATTGADTASDDTEEQNPPIDLTEVPYGDDYVVVIKIYDAISDTPNLLYTGLSSVFSLKKGQDSSTDIVLSSVQLSIEPPKQVDDGAQETQTTSKVALYLELNKEMFSDFADETTVQFSNTESFDQKSKMMLSTLAAYKDGYKLSEWDTNSGVCTGDENCIEGKQSVYARLVNAVYGEEEIVVKTNIEIPVNTDPPKLVEPLPELPEITNQPITMELTFDKTVFTSQVLVNCDGIGTPKITPLDEEINSDGRSVGTSFRVTCPVEAITQNRSYTISVSAMDTGGIQSENIVLGSVEVDTLPPNLSPWPTPYPSSTLGLGDSAQLELSFTEPLRELTVTFGDEDITDDCELNSVSDSRICSISAEPDVPEGVQSMGIVATDHLGNKSTLFPVAAITFDYTAPEVTEYTVKPAFATVGTTIEIDVTLSESTIKRALNKDEEPWINLVAVVGGVNQYHGTYVVGENDANGTYSLSVTAEDAARNVAENLPIGQVVIDTEKPYLEGEITVDRLVTTLGEPFHFSFTTSEVTSAISGSIGLMSIDISKACTVSNGGRTFDCVHASSPAESEGPKDITIYMTDQAGNKGNGGKAQAITYNHAFPTVKNKEVSPQKVKVGSTVFVNVSFSEIVGNVKMDWGGLPFGYDPPEGSWESNYFFRFDIESNVPEGMYNFFLESAEDNLGQPVPETYIGGIEVDTTAPTIVGDLTVDRALAKDGDPVQIQFSVSEPLSALRLRIDDVYTNMNVSQHCNSNLLCTYWHYADENPEKDGLKDITVELTDIAGNPNTVVVKDILRYDFNLPEVDILTTRISPTPAMDNDIVTVVLTFTEPVKPESISMNWNGLPLSGLTDSGDHTMYTATFTVSTAITQGKYDIRVARVVDMAGNVQVDLALPPIIIARKLYVDSAAPDDGDGLSWTTAYNNLKYAIKTAKSGQEVWVKKGFYRLSGDIEEDNPQLDTFTLKKGVKIYGGFNGRETNKNSRSFADSFDYPDAEADANGTPAYSVLDGLLLDRNPDDDDSYVYHVVTVSGEGHLDGFAITNGNATGTEETDTVGGGILINSGTIELANCVIRDNFALKAGGGMYSYMSSVAMRNCVVADNESAKEGGGVDAENLKDLHISQSVFRKNTAEGDGGGLLLYNFSGETIIHNTEFSQNLSTHGYGGGLKNVSKAPFSCVNCAFFNNSAQYGAGISDGSGGPIEIHHSTFAENLAQIAGHGIYLEDKYASQMKVSNTILWRSDNTCQIETSQDTGSVVISYTDMPACDASPLDFICEVDNSCIDSNPEFREIDDPWDYRLSEDSPCIDMGIPCQYRSKDSLDLDQDGYTAEEIPWDIDNENRCNGAYVDMGAYEY